jgi:excisionase family DNA binding protein
VSKKISAQLAPLETLRRYPVEIAAAYFGVSRAHLFKRIKNGEIATIRDGRRVFVPGSEIARLSKLPAHDPTTTWKRDSMGVAP